MTRIVSSFTVVLVLATLSGCDVGPLSSNIAFATVDGQRVVVVKTCGREITRIAFREGSDRTGEVVASVDVDWSGGQVEYVDVSEVDVVRHARPADDEPLFVVDVYSRRGFSGDQVTFTIPPEGSVTFSDREIIVEELSQFLQRDPGCGPSPSASASAPVGGVPVGPGPPVPN